MNLLLVNSQDHGIHRDGLKETDDAESDFARRTLAHDVNRHAAVVLEGRALGRMNLLAVTCHPCYYLLNFFPCPDFVVFSSTANGYETWKISFWKDFYPSHTSTY